MRSSIDKTLEKSLAKWLKSQQNACGIYLKLSILFGLLNGLAILGQAYCIATILHQVIMLETPADKLFPYFAGLGGLLITRALLVYVREQVSFKAGMLLRQTMRQAILDKLVRLGPAFIKGKPAGSWASIVLEQVEDLHDYYSKYLPQMTIAGFIPLVILVVVFPLNWAAGLVLLGTAPLIPLFMILVGMGAADANRKNFSALSRLSGHFMDRLKGLSTLKLFNRGVAETKQIEQASEDFRSRTMSVLRLAFLSSAVLEFFAALSIALLAVYFGFSYLDHLDFGHYGLGISLFTGMFVLILAPEFYQPLRDLGAHYHAKAQAIGAAESIVELLDYPEPLTQQEALQKPALDAVHIQADKLVVKSLDGKVLLGPISFTLNAGQHLGIVGKSGAGKTSLMQALLGFLPYEGSLTINQVELNATDKGWWRSRIAWLGQNPQLFNGTIAENVALSNPDMSQEHILKLLDDAQLSKFIQSCSLGIHTQIGDQAQGVSVGQAQRIALARALGQSACVFLLDEPTASLDSDSASKVMTSLQGAMAGKTALFITHKLDKLEQFDAVMVLDNGQVAEYGQVSELLENQGALYQLMQEDK